MRAFVRYNSRGDHGRLDDVSADVLAEVDVYAGDLQNPEAVANAVADRDAVLHLGALIPIPYSYRHPREYVFANVDGTINVLEASRRAGVSRIVQVSSSRGVRHGADGADPGDASAEPAVAVRGDEGRGRSALPVLLALVRRPGRGGAPLQHVRATPVRPRVIPTVITQALEPRPRSNWAR